MTTLYKMSDIQGLIVIDVHNQKWLDLWSEKVKLKLQPYMNNINHIINANGHVPTCNIDNDITQLNTWTEYKRITPDNDIIVEYFSIYPNMSFSDIIKNENYFNWFDDLYQNDYSYFLLNLNHFISHVQSHVPHIKNWLVIGGHWTECAHFRHIGFDNLKSLPYNFFITPWSMFDRDLHPYHSITHEMIKNDTSCENISWEPHHDDMYILIDNT